jgi:hypothetical protein
LHFTKPNPVELLRNLISKMQRNRYVRSTHFHLPSRIVSEYNVIQGLLSNSTLKDVIV